MAYPAARISIFMDSEHCVCEQAGSDAVLARACERSKISFPDSQFKAKSANSFASSILRRRMRNLICGSSEGAVLNSVDAQPQQKRGQRWIAGHFAAQAAPDALALRGVGRQFDQAQDGGMGGFVKVGDSFVEPVHRQRVLDQIVGAQAEKIDAARPANPRRRRRRGFQSSRRLEFYRRRRVFSARNSGLYSARSALALSNSAMPRSSGT